MTTKVSYFIRKEYRFNKDHTKIQVIDKYGRTAWVTEEEAKNHRIPQYANGPANLDADYRPVYNGEEDLTNFIKTYLSIPNVQKYVDGKWVMVDNPADCEARLGEADKLFDGNFKEIKDIMSYQPNNKVKILFGVRTTDDGKQYQTVASREDLILHNNAGSNAITKLATRLAEMKSNGSFANTDFRVQELAEYDVQPTNLDQPASGNKGSEDSSSGDMPWD
jgi:hypothetical protein